MARPRSWTWTVIVSVLVGIAGATAFWLYTPYGHEQLGQQVGDDLKSQPSISDVKGGAPNLPKTASQAKESRFQIVNDNNQVFVMDSKSGRIWRYFRQTKEGGFSREDEGFLPIPFYYAGKKHYTASEIEPAAGDAGNPAVTTPQGKQSQ